MARKCLAWYFVQGKYLVDAILSLPLIILANRTDAKWQDPDFN